MSTHIQLTGTEPETLRSLFEVCSFCDAPVGAPCRIVIVKEDKRGQYICPHVKCEELFDHANDAMSCAMDGEIAEQ